MEFLLAVRQHCLSTHPSDLWGLQVCVEVVGYLLEELRDAKNYALFQKDMQNANIFIGSLIFIEELAEKVCASLVSHLVLRQLSLVCFEDSVPQGSGL